MHIGQMGPGHALGRYELLVPIANGGMAHVWAARLRGPRGFQRIVAIKLLSTELSDDREYEAMFLDEARLASRLRHPNVAAILELGEQAGLLYHVVEYVDGEPLSTVGRALGRLPLHLVINIGVQACAGLHAAHELRDASGQRVNLVHRDVSPQNLMVGYDGILKVVDFGIAKATSNSHKTHAGQLKGKVSYMSPEQAGTGAVVDRRTDVFALGIVLYQLTTGRHPFRGDNDVVTLHHICSRSVPARPSTLRPGIPGALDSVIMRALDKDVERRFASMAHLSRALEGASAGELARAEDLAAFMSEHLQERGDARRKALYDAIEALDARDACGAGRRAAAFAIQDPPSSTGSHVVHAETISPSSYTDAPPAAQRAALASGGERASDAPALRRRRGKLRGSGAVFAAALVVLGIASTYPNWLPAAGAPTPLSSLSQLAPPPLALPALGPHAASVRKQMAKRRSECPAGMVLVPGGKFYMGSDDPAFKLWRPAHKVVLDTFCIDAFEVSAGDYRACSDQGECKRPEPVPDYPKSESTSQEQHEKNRAAYGQLCTFGKPGLEKHPINCVSWHLAHAYCRAQDKRLPTEAEWEYAARGSDGRKFPWGDAPGSLLHMNACGAECSAWETTRGVTLSPRMYDASDGYPGTAPIGSFPAGRTKHGAHDMVGNVWEWTADWFETYRDAESVNPTGAPAGDRKAIRGGGFNGGVQLWVNPAFRYHQLATASSHGIGFRCVMNL